MTGKILLLLVPVLAIIALAPISATAQGGPVVQINGVAASSGNELQIASSHHFSIQTILGNINCEKTDLNIFLTNNHHGIVNGDSFEECELEGTELPVDIRTNASEGWQFLIGEGDTGVIQRLLFVEGGTGTEIVFEAQIQSEEKVSLATCAFAAAYVPFIYSQGSDLELFVNSEAFGACGKGILEATFKVTPAGEPAGQVTVE